MSAAQPLHFSLEGPPDAPPVVLLHSIATSGEMWAPQIAPWATRFRLVRIDLPGHGKSSLTADNSGLASYADRVSATLDSLAISSAMIVGLSLGGMVAQALALSSPGRVRALVLAHAGARTPPAVADAWRDRIAQVASHGMASQVAPTLDRWFTPEFAARSPQTLAWLAGLISSTSPIAYRAAAAAIVGLDHLDRLSDLNIPTMVVSGARDTAVPPELGRAMASKISEAQFVELPDAAHLGNVEQPVAFTEIVGDFLHSSAARHCQ